MTIESDELQEAQEAQPGDVQFTEPGAEMAVVPEKPKRRPRLPITSLDVLTGVLLLLILMVGAYFRFTGQNWDDYTHLHPDERFMAGVTDQLGGPLGGQVSQREICQARYPETGGAATSIFDSQCSTWYPPNYGQAYFYGELPLYVVKAASVLTAQVSGNPEWTRYNQVQLVGRSVSAIADLITICFLFLIGRRLYNRWVGLLAAALYAASVFAIQLSHYWTTDAFTNLPVIVAFWFAVRAMDRGKWYDFIGFGVGLGCAMASKINTAFLAGIIVLAAIIYALPALDITLPRGERWRLIRRAIGGVIVAGIVTVITFRITMPHAFTGGPGVLGFFNIIPNSTWLDTLRQSQAFASGSVDFPPNHQWASRTPFLFPWRNMVLWGMGIPLGLMSWFGWLWAAVQVLRARPLWTRHILPFTWILVYFGYVGRQWVMTMRYYINLYPFLILLGSWALYELVTSAWRWTRDHPTMVRRLALAGSSLLLVIVLAGTFLWAAMFVRIYQRQLTRVEATRWEQRNLPSGISTVVTGSGGMTRLANLYADSSFSLDMSSYQPDKLQVINIPRLGIYTFDRVIVSHLLNPAHDTQNRQFSVMVSMDNIGGQILAQGSIQGDFPAKTDPLGDSYTIILDRPVMLNPDQGAYLLTESDGPLTVIQSNGGDPAFVLTNGTATQSVSLSLPHQDKNGMSMFGPTPIQTRLNIPIAGTIDHFDIRHLLTPLGSGTAVELRLRVLNAQDQSVLDEGVLKTDAGSTKTSQFGEAYTVKLTEPLAVDPSRPLLLEVASSVPVQVTGTVIAWEGDWDDPLPWAVCPLPPQMELTHDTPSGVNPPRCEAFGGLGTWYRETKLQMASEDDQNKRETIQNALDQADYYVISSNRFYDSLTRMPMRFPMTIDFYNALFAGQLGFDVNKLFTSYASLGSFEVADEYLPTYNAPKWLNEWESEEAFTVYDHPAVFLFKKNAAYTSQRLSDVLNKVPITSAEGYPIHGDYSPDPTLLNRTTWTPTESTAAPTGFQLTAQQRDIQTQGGTWSDLFNRNWPINASPLLAVVAWWALMLILGFAAWPILFVILPGLPDRGYPLTKIAGLLIVSWVVWAGGTLQLLTWTQTGIALTTLALIIVGALVAFRHRAALLDYMRLNWRHLLIIEMITFILFLVLIFVRLGNPDLWAQSLGGEKPMDFAFLNGVLKSTIFPPYDPWYANGYLNYYYYGFVLVGTPVKLLGIEPSIAYNLIVPTLFAMTGIAAFSVTFNLVASRWFFPEDDGEDRSDAPVQARRRFALRVPAASPYLAGTLALLLCVVLGNLDTPRTFLTGVASAGGFAADNRPDASGLYLWKINQFVAQNNRQPTPEESARLLDESNHPSLADEINYSVYSTQKLIGSLGSGLGQVFGGGALPIGAERWFWGPTRIVSELPNSNNEIQEMPYFTFLFADLHAHMVAMPLTLLAIAWLLAEILAAGNVQRPTWVAITATAFGALVIGSLQPTNTWDWFTYLLLSLLGLTFAMMLRRPGFNRRAVLTWAGQLAWFFAVEMIVVLPFTAYWSTSYLATKTFDGNKTPIWAYFDIHGVFLFAIVSLLVWQTARLLRRMYVRDFVGRPRPLLIVLAVVIFTALVSLFLFLVPGQFWLVNAPIPLAIVLLPLLAWCVILFFVPDQSRAMQVILALVGLALGVTFGVEVVVLGADIGRQNTFFKFYMQAWILFSVASGAALAWLIQASKSWRISLRGPWLGSLAVLLAIAGLFPIMATQGKIAVRMASNAPHTLDGDAYMEYATYYEGSTAIPLRDDLQIIHWLQDNVKGSPVILEAALSEYKLGGRISINTGLPTIIGWRFHESQQRTIDPLGNIIWERTSNVAAMYDLTDIPTVWKMLTYYHIEYIVVSKLEQTVYNADGLAKFDDMVKQRLLEPVYNHDYMAETTGDKGQRFQQNVLNRIYRVVPGAAPDILQAGG